MSSTLLALALSLTSGPGLVTDDYVDDARCARCHADISHGFTSLGMGRSFAVPGPDTAVADFTADGGAFAHGASGQQYRMWLDDDGHMWMRQFELDDYGSEINAVDIQAHFAVGSANHARTYLHRTPSGELFELPVTWYAHGGWNMSPGYDRAGHNRFERRVGRECLFCHNAYPDVATGEDRLGRPESFPEVLPAGIGCQRCHGPGRDHVDLAYSADATDAQIKASILNPAHLEPAAQDEVCLQCHLQPTSRLGSLVRPFDRGDFSYRPGTPLSDYIAHIEYDVDGDAATDAFEVNHHAFQLRHSACWQGEGSLNCLSCHNPHHKSAAADRAQRYRAACLACHEEPDCRVEPVTGVALAEGADCTSCHMPQRRPSDAIHVVVTDHRIQLPPRDPNALLAPLAETASPAVLHARLHRGPDAISTTLQHMGHIVSGDNTPASQLAASLSDTSTDSMRLFAGEALLESGQLQQAGSILSALTERSPWMLTGQVNLALIEAQTIGLEPAITRLQQVIAETPLAADAWSRLAMLQWNAGKKPQALAAAREAARLRPLTPSNWHRLGIFLAASNQLSTAADAFKRAEALHPGDASNGYNLGLALWRTDQCADAARSWRHALRHSPEDERMLKMAAIAAALPFPAVAATPADEAESLVRRWMAAAPDAADALALLAAVQQAAGDPGGASATLQQAADAKADLAAVRIVQALLLHDAARLDDAVALWKRVSEAIDQPSSRTMLREGLLNRGRAVFGD